MARIKRTIELSDEEKQARQAAADRQTKLVERQTKLAALAEKRQKGQLKLEDIDTKLDVIIEILQDLMPPK